MTLFDIETKLEELFAKRKQLEAEHQQQIKAIETQINDLTEQALDRFFVEWFSSFPQIQLVVWSTTVGFEAAYRKDFEVKTIVTSDLAYNFKSCFPDLDDKIKAAYDVLTKEFYNRKQEWWLRACKLTNYQTLVTQRQFQSTRQGTVLL